MTQQTLDQICELVSKATTPSDVSSVLWIIKARVATLPDKFSREEHLEIQDHLSAVCRRLLMRKTDNGAEVRR